MIEFRIHQSSQNTRLLQLNAVLNHISMLTTFQVEVLSLHSATE